MLISSGVGRYNNGCSSDPMTNNAFIPQGSVISAMIFLLYIKDLLKPFDMQTIAQ